MFGWKMLCHNKIEVHRHAITFQWFYCLLWDTACTFFNLGINPNKILGLGKNYQKLGKYRPFWIGKQPVFGCNIVNIHIGIIKSLAVRKREKNSKL